MTITEIHPLFAMSVKPVPRTITWYGLLAPNGHSDDIPGQIAWPNTVDKDALSIRISRRPIDSLD